MRTLTRAVSMLPGNLSSRLDLSFALTESNRFDEALTQVTAAAGLANDGCKGAAVWRQLGHIFFAKGALHAAQNAYEISLSYESKNTVAQNSIQTIKKLLRESQSGTQEPPVSLPPLKMTVVRCGASAEK